MTPDRPTPRPRSCSTIGLSRSVLTTNLFTPKLQTVVKPLGMVWGSKVAVPVKVSNGFTNCVRRPTPTHSPAIEVENLAMELDCGEDLHTSRKRRLDHLSIEEKLKRKKLKNRVAAQTSRDRKKARMDELEAEVKKLQDENKVLVQENFVLQIEKEKLSAENERLQEKLSKAQSDVSCSPLVGPAESIVDPQPQGRGLHLAPGLCGETAWGRILTFCILSQISLPTMANQNTSSPNWKSLQQAFFEKGLTTKDKKSLHRWMARLLTVMTRTAPVEWWGHHQNTWNPVENKVQT